MLEAGHADAGGRYALPPSPRRSRHSVGAQSLGYPEPDRLRGDTFSRTSSESSWRGKYASWGRPGDDELPDTGPMEMQTSGPSGLSAASPSPSKKSGKRGESMSTLGNSGEIGTSFIQREPSLERISGMPWRGALRRVLRSRVVEGLISAVVVLNFVLTTMETDAGAEEEREAPQWVCVMLDVCYVSVVAEFALRVLAEQEVIFSTAFVWLDLFIIVSGLVEYLVRWTQGTSSDLQIIRILRICRLVRLVRVVRHIRSFTELSKLVQMMGSCFKTLFWSFVLLAFVMTTWAVLAVEFIHPRVKELVQERGEWPDCERCRRSFASVFDANLTLFQTIIAGDSWGQVALPILEFSPELSIIFIGSLLTLVFGVLNLVLAVVVDASAERRAKDVVTRGAEMEVEEITEKRWLNRIFDRIDLNKNGEVSFEELRAGARRNGEFRNWLRILDIDSSDLFQLFQMVDKDNSGEIDRAEFIEVLWRIKHAESKTATTFIKDLVRKIHQQQAELEMKLEQLASKVCSSRDSGQDFPHSSAWAQHKRLVTEEVHQKMALDLSALQSSLQYGLDPLDSPRSERCHVAEYSCAADCRQRPQRKQPRPPARSRSGEQGIRALVPGALLDPATPATPPSDATPPDARGHGRLPGAGTKGHVPPAALRMKKPQG